MTGLFLTLAACGAIGTPVVVAERTAVGEVEIVAMSANNVRAANASTYQPRTLPAIFSRTAGTAGSVRGLGAIPEAPYEPENRPGSMPTRLPPDIAPQPYRIGVGDVVVLATAESASTVEALSGLLAAQNRRQGYTVQDDGSISIPDVGRVDIGGLTLQEAEQEVFRALVDQDMVPNFSIEISDFNSKRVSLGGAVRNPRNIPITLAPLNLSEALTAAGGLTASNVEYASIRLYRDGSMYQIPLATYLETPSVQKIRLKDGDALYVDTNFDLDQAQAYFQQQITLRGLQQSARADALSQLNSEIGIRRNELSEARSNFSARVQFDAVERDYVYIAGEVGQQSRFTLPFERKASLADALFSEGGGVPNASGNIGEDYVLRGSGDGRGIRAWHLDAYNAANLVLATRFELRPNDVIFVSEKPLTALSRVIGEVAASVSILGI
ncbi:MAG: sugar transporter [Maritimibacter sp.]|nr:polysaccharide biosynthesis/export family protein [Maritimibacter sp. UBA3975]MAM60428.1 sugar transporter [Maritimibacter sp.]|tara:strand:+ start:22979 stop:24298 length:1320 start_codon:yes stop_codon:yes gene_type:complete